MSQVTYKTQLILTVGSGGGEGDAHLDGLSSAITPHFVIKLYLGERGN